jgi:hypothetical protein
MPSHRTSRRSLVILSSHLRLDLAGGLLPSGLPTKILYTPLLSPVRVLHAPPISFSRSLLASLTLQPSVCHFCSVSRVSLQIYGRPAVHTWPNRTVPVLNLFLSNNTYLLINIVPLIVISLGLIQQSQRPFHRLKNFVKCIVWNQASAFRDFAWIMTI